MKLVLLSGGYDSALAAALSGATRGLFVDYGQPYSRQESRAVEAADSWLRRLDARWQGTDRVACKLLQGEGAEVPARNLALCALAANRASLLRAESVVVATRGFLVGYADSGLRFALAVRLVPGMPRFEFPLMGWTKRRVMRRLRALAAPMRELWSCYGDGEQRCGKCGACRDTSGLL